MIRALAILILTFATGAAIADHHKGEGKPGKGKKDMHSEMKAEKMKSDDHDMGEMHDMDEIGEEDMDDERTPEERAAHKAEMMAKKDARKTEAMALNEGKADAQAMDANEGRENAMEKRNSENSQREEAVAESKGKPWWKFWD